MSDEQFGETTRRAFSRHSNRCNGGHAGRARSRRGARRRCRQSHRTTKVAAVINVQRKSYGGGESG